MPKYTNYSYLSHQLEKKGIKNSRSKHTILWCAVAFIIVNLIIFYIVTAQPKFALTIDDKTSFTSVEVTLKLQGLYPKKDVYMDIDGDPIDFTKSGKEYSATIENNGTLAVRVTNLNGMEKTEYVHISSIDDAPPIISLVNDSDGQLVLSFEDTQSGVNYDTIYGLDSNDTRISPSLVDEGSASVTFNYDGLLLEVHISDRVGHESIASFGRDSVATDNTEAGSEAGLEDNTDNTVTNSYEESSGDSTSINIDN